MRLLGWLMVLLFFSACSGTSYNSSEITIFGPSSLTNVLEDLAQTFEEQQNIQVKVNIASSGMLARQIEQGASPDIYISADKKWIEYLENKGYTKEENTKLLATNSLVLIAPLQSTLDSIHFTENFDRDFDGRIAMGDPQHVPAGEYAWEALKNAGYLKTFEKRIIPAQDVRAALLLVELGESEAGIVFKTDAIQSQKVKIINSIPSHLHKPVEIIATSLSNDTNSKLFYDFLTSATAQNIFKKYQFNVD